jgi:arylsulfatase A-like enzyme
MNEGKEHTTRVNPFTTGMVIGLGWGLALGFWDGLPVLLEIPILEHLRVRVQAVLYLMVWYGLAGVVSLGVLGLVTWGLLRLLRRKAGRRGLVAVYSGISLGLIRLVSEIYRLPAPLARPTETDHTLITLALVGIAGVLGVAVGLGLYAGIGWWQSGRGFLRPLHWKVARTGILAIFLAAIVVLTAVGVYRGYLSYLPIFCQRTGQPVTPEHPNVVLITIDALRADHLGIYGYDPTISPNIDALAGRGVVFERAIAQGPRTDPSVGSFITSLYPSELVLVQETELSVDKMRVTLAEAFQNAGYRTEAYITNPLLAPENGLNQGFDYYAFARPKLLFDLDKLRKRTLVWLVCQRYAKAPSAQAVCKLFDWGHEQLFDPSLIGWQRDEWVTEYTKRFLHRYQDGRFFLWLYYVGPHMPYDPPEPFHPLPEEITSRREHDLRYPGSWVQKSRDSVRPIDREAMISLYDGEIAYTDDLIGQVLDELDRMGLMDHTLFILNADHGEEFGEHGNYGHGALYEEVLRVPFIISGPGIEAVGERVGTQVSLLDLVPTTCELAGVPIPEEAEGRSLVPFLQREDMEELPAFAEVGRNPNLGYESKSIRYRGYKLIYRIAREEAELYDLRTDPHEQMNLAEQEPEIVEMMLVELKAWMARNAQVAAELPRQRAPREELDREMERRLREAGY